MKTIKETMKTTEHKDHLEAVLLAARAVVDAERFKSMRNPSVMKAALAELSRIINLYDYDNKPLRP